MIKRLAFWTLFPLVVPQALIVRRTAPRFAGAAGNNTGCVGEGDRSKLLAVGDSIIAGVGAGSLVNALVGKSAKSIASRFDVCVEWTAMGKIGATAESLRGSIIPRIPAQEYDVIVVSTGVNDVTGLKRSSTFERHLRGIVSSLQEHSPNAQIVMLGVPPLGAFPLLPRPLRWVLGMRAQTFDRIARRVANEQPGARHLPVEFEPDPTKFAADGYHPSESSYTDLGELIGQSLTPVGRRATEEYSGTNVFPIRPLGEVSKTRGSGRRTTATGQR